MNYRNNLSGHAGYAGAKRTRAYKLAAALLLMVLTVFIVMGLLNGNIDIEAIRDGFKTLPQEEEDVTREVRIENEADMYEASYIALEKRLEDYLSGIKGLYGMYYYDIYSQTGFGINDDYVYTAASTVKIPLNLYLFEKIADGSVSPEELMTYSSKDYEAGTGIIQYEETGKQYTLRQLSRLSIVESDNIAANMLLRRLGRRELKNYMRELGGKVVSDSENISCPLDMALYMRKTYDFCMDNNVLGSELMNSYENTKHNDRIPEGLPKGVRVAHKIGSWPPSAYHDVGIVFAQRPYILAVMSRDAESCQEAVNTIAFISEEVYKFVEENY
jgi:beta-lactamase class A